MLIDDGINRLYNQKRIQEQLAQKATQKPKRVEAAFEVHLTKDQNKKGSY